MNKNYLPIIGLLIVFCLFWFLIIPFFTKNYLYTEATWLLGMDKCVKGFQVPCRWVPSLGGMYGYPLFNFYAPLPYYFGEIFYLLSNSLTFAVKIMLATSVVVSFVFAYFLGRKFWGKKRGVLSAALYTLISHSLVIFYLPGETILGKIWTMMFLPVLLWITFRLKKSVNLLNLLLLTLFYSFIILSSDLNIVVFLPLLLLSILLFCFQPTNRFLKFSIFSMLLGLLLSTFYWLPMIMENDVRNCSQPIKRTVLEFLPTCQGKLPDKPLPSSYEILTGTTDIFDYQEGINRIFFKADTKSHSIIRLSQYYFPGWKVYVDGHETKVDYKNSLGLMTFILGKGEHQVEAKLDNSPIRVLANSLTVLGMMILLILILLQFPKTKRWILYYLQSFYK